MTATGPGAIDIAIAIDPGGGGGGMAVLAPIDNAPPVRTGSPIGSAGGGMAVTITGGRVGKPIRGIPSTRTSQKVNSRNKLIEVVFKKHTRNISRASSVIERLFK